MSATLSGVMRPCTSPLLRAAAAELQRQGGSVAGLVHIEITGPDRARVIIERDLSQTDLEPTPPPNPPVQPAATHRVREFSPNEEAILRVCTREWQTGPEIAELLGQKCGSALYTLLANLAERGALESSRAGYRLPLE